MKRKDSRYRALPSLARFVRPITDLQDLARLASTNGQPGLRSRRIFVVKQVKRLKPTTGTRKKIRRILIFDNHPDSLRLVFGHRTNQHVHLSAPPRASSRDAVLVSLLALGLLILMFWPLF